VGRLVIEIPGAARVDAIAGHHVADTAPRLCSFLLAAPDIAATGRCGG
jgi:hypothetical protein